MINLTDYERIKASSDITGQDFEPMIIKDVFSEEQLDYIYKYINVKQADDEKWAGRKSWMIERINGLGNGISTKIEQVTKDAIGVDVKLNEFPFLLRYSPKYGYISKLFPHSDYRDSQRVTIDVQLKHDEQWPIVIEGKEYILNYNEALIFLGTQQLHWRTDKVLKNDTEIDMLIANVHYDPDRPLDENQMQILDSRGDYLKNATQIFFAEEINDAY
jgi:hypothetical protein